MKVDAKKCHELGIFFDVFDAETGEPIYYVAEADSDAGIVTRYLDRDGLFYPDPDNPRELARVTEHRPIRMVAWFPDAEFAQPALCGP